ncbi:MAG: lipoprotein LpqH [Mycobacteriaceae bacterium]|nr:lipoprotein LpqH [Mycobacteriaceae bacterium]
MDNRGVAVLVAVAVAGAAACSSQQQTGGQVAARITMNGVTQTAYDVRCSEDQGFWTVDVGGLDADTGVEAVVALSADKATPKWVKIHNYGGFTGSFWEGGVGSASASATPAELTVTGTAYGADLNRNKPTTTNFKIVANC